MAITSMTIPRQHTVETPYMVGPVHFYTLEYGAEIVLFDTGPPTDTGRLYLQQHLDLSRLKHVIVTHCHVDHYGQAAWLAKNSGANVYLPQRDIDKHIHHQQRIEGIILLLSELGFDAPYFELLRESFYRAVVLQLLPEHYLVAEHDLPPHLGIEALACPGHSQSDLVYCADGWAVTGDTLLRGIFQSPLLDMDLETGGRFKNYEAYCSSLASLASLGARQVLPGHRQTIESVEATILFYVCKILQRVRQLRTKIDCGSVAELINRVFSQMKDPFHIYLKASEIVFMRDFWANPELLRAALEAIGLFDKVSERYFAVFDQAK
ncbi:MAG: MBL fold metallo-hydrolase [Desulfocapsaceae bacterium]